MLRDIPLSRLLLYFGLIVFLPLIFVLIQLNGRRASLNDLQMHLETIQETALAKQSKQALNRRIRAHYLNADHFYIDKHLESLTFLKPEIEKLEQAMEEKEVGSNEEVAARLDFLIGQENHIRFTEGAVLRFDGIQETPETLVRSIELNLEDLQQLLAHIEGLPVGPFEPPEGRPLMLVLDFKIERKTVVGDHEVMSLSMKLLKREFS